jgi:hypothetical protein
VHGVDAKSAAVVARSVRRGGLLKFFASLPRCLVGMEVPVSPLAARRDSISPLGLGREPGKLTPRSEPRGVMGTFDLRLVATGLAFALAAVAPGGAANMEKRPPPLDLKPGQEFTIPISIVDGHVATGAPRASKLGASQPQDGEIIVGLEREQGTLYNQITVVEKTAQPINFLVTGLNGGTEVGKSGGSCE